MATGNMKIGTRLGLGFGALILLLAIIAIISIKDLKSLNSEIDNLVNDKFPKTVLANDIIDNVNIIARAMRNTLILKDKDAVAKELERIQNTRKIITEKFDKLKEKIKSEEGKAVLNSALDARAKYVVAQEQFLKLIGEGKQAEATDYLLTEVRKLQNGYLDGVTKLIEFQTKLMLDVGKQASDQVSSALTLIIVLGLVALVMGIAIGFLITRSLLKQLGGEPDYAAEVARKVAAGDLAMKIAVKEGDTGSLLFAMKEMQDMLAKIVTDIKEAVDSVNTASKEIASGNTDLSQRTEEQASSLEETASSMEELTSTVRQNAENSKQANQLAVSASDVAGRGGEVVGQVVDTMSSINESSRKIVDIISVIDGIAFQTNILALNAAVEAARAGEQGRGFAVVAAEVRNLAQRSAAAAKEIKALIGDSVDKVENGAKLVEQAGQTMDEIVTSIKRVTDIMAEISAASIEQSAGIEQVNQAITQMDDVTQQNAALVEQAAASAEALEEQAQNLARAVSVFRLNEGAGVSAAERRVAAKPAAKPAPKAAAKPAVKPVPASLAKKTAVAAKPASGDDDEWKEF